MLNLGLLLLKLLSEKRNDKVDISVAKEHRVLVKRLLLDASPARRPLLKFW